MVVAPVVTVNSHVFSKKNLCSKLLPKLKEIMRSNYSREERQKIVLVQIVHKDVPQRQFR